MDSAKFDIQTWLSANPDFSSIELDRLLEKAKKDSFSLIFDTFPQLACTFTALEEWMTKELPLLKERLAAIAGKIIENSTVANANGKEQLLHSPSSSNEESTNKLREQQRRQFEELAELLDNFHLFATAGDDSNSRILLRVLGGSGGLIRQIHSPVSAAGVIHDNSTAGVECAMFLCNDILLVAFNQGVNSANAAQFSCTGESGKFSIETSFNLADLKMESYGCLLRLCQNDGGLAAPFWEYEFANVELLTAFCQVLADAVQAAKQELHKELFSSLKLPEWQKSKKQSSNNCQENIEIFKRTPQLHSVNALHSPAHSRSKSKLAYIWKQIQNVHDFTLQTDYDKAIEAALSASLSLANISGVNCWNSSKENGTSIDDSNAIGGKNALSKSSFPASSATTASIAISQVLSTRISTLFSFIATELAKAANCSKSKLILQLKRLIRLGFASAARTLFLESSEERLKLKVNKIPFPSNEASSTADDALCQYVSQISHSTFTAIRNCVGIYTGIFPQSEYSHLVAWCDTCLLALVVKVRRHLLECEGNSFYSICCAFRICLKDCKEILSGSGIHLSPFLENYLIPDVLSLIFTQQSRIIRMIEMEEEAQQLVEASSIVQKLQSFGLNEVACEMAKQQFQGQKPSEQLLRMFCECQMLIDGICMLATAAEGDSNGGFVELVMQVLVQIFRSYLEWLAEKPKDRQVVRDSLILSQRLLRFFGLQIEGGGGGEKAGVKMDCFCQFQEECEEWISTQTLPKAKAYLIEHTVERLKKVYFNSESTSIKNNYQLMKVPTGPMREFIGDLEEFWHLEKQLLSQEMLLQLGDDWSGMQQHLGNVGVHLMMCDLFTLGAVTSLEIVSDAIYHLWDYWKTLGEESEILNLEWSDEELFTRLPVIYREQANGKKQRGSESG